MLAWSLAGVSALRADHYVAQAGQNPESPFLTPGTAASNIQEAVSIADSGATVRVGPGRYYAMPGSNTVIRWTDKSLILRGDSANPAAVIIDGDGAQRGMYVDINNFGALVEVDGFIFTNGYVAGSGAGLYLYAAAGAACTGMVRNCIFKNNNSIGNAGGGASLATPTGGEFYSLVTNCSFIDNTTSGHSGAGLTVSRNVTAIVDKCVFENNTGDRGGGIYNYGSAIWVNNCRFIGNTTTVSDTCGAGAYLYSGTSVLTGCRFEGNRAQGGGYGGGIATRAKLSLTNCVLLANEASQGGGIFARAETPCVNVCNSLIAFNSSDIGGGFYAANASTGDFIFANCTIVSNYMNGGSSAGGLGIAGGTANVAIWNTILYHNIRSTDATRNNYSFTTGVGVKEFYHSCAFPSVAGGVFDGGNNTSNDPLLIDFTNQNFNLSSQSPCVNTGTNQPWMTGSLNVDGTRRVDRASGLVDMGCFEYLPRGIMFTVW